MTPDAYEPKMRRYECHCICTSSIVVEAFNIFRIILAASNKEYCDADYIECHCKPAD